MGNLFSFATATTFLKKCALEIDNVQRAIRIIGNISLPNRMDSWKRAKIYNHLDFSMLFFRQRLDLFLEGLDNKRINLDILESLFRGLIEIYSRILFVLNSPENEAVTRIIWQDIYLIALLSPEMSRRQNTQKVLRIDYSILQSIGQETYPISIIRKNIDIWLKGETPDKKIKKLLDQNRFPKVGYTIRKFHDENEEPKIPKYLLIKRYSELSEQIHGNFLLEREDSGQKSKYRIVAFLIMLTLVFLKALSGKAKSEADIALLIKEFSALRVDYLRLWGPFFFHN